MPDLQIDRIVDIVVGELLRGGIADVSPAAAAADDQQESGPRERIASLIDHTLLRSDATRSDMERLCREALEFGFATVCVNPVWLPTCRVLLRPGELPSTQTASARADRHGSLVRPGLCSVVGFPLGATTSDVKAFETRRAIADGATEIDMVMNVGALKSGDLLHVARDIEEVTRACREVRVTSKVIIETALLTEEEKVAACVIARSAGADYVKTSTGFATAGATSGDVRLMRRVVGDRMGVKASGGIRDVATARAMLDAGATRIGTSAGVDIVRGARLTASAGSSGSY